VKRSGSNFSGSGKYVASECRPNTGIYTPDPTGSVIDPVPVGAGSSYSMQHVLSTKGTIGYFLRVSVNTGADNRNVKYKWKSNGLFDT
jgi:hypothetical protein